MSTTTPPPADYRLLAHHNVRVLALCDAAAGGQAPLPMASPEREAWTTLALVAERVPEALATTLANRLMVEGGACHLGPVREAGEFAITLQLSAALLERLITALRAGPDASATALAAALEHARTGGTFETLCDVLCQWHEPAAVPMQAAGMLKRWVLDQMIVAAA